MIAMFRCPFMPFLDPPRKKVPRDALEMKGDISLRMGPTRCRATPALTKEEEEEEEEEFT